MNSTIECRFRLNLGSFDLDTEFSVSAQGVIGLFGESGCGKTTLLRCIAGLDRSARGSLCVAGESWQDDAQGLFVPPHLREVGVVFQDTRLFPHLDVQRNLEYGRKRKDQGGSTELFDRIVNLFDLSKLLLRTPENLSGGERQRVAIARALLTRPRLLLMDEPLASLDRRRKQELMPFLEKLHHELEVPIIYVSHSLTEMAHLADYLLLMEGGKICEKGPAQELLTRVDLPVSDALNIASFLEGTVDQIDERFELAHLSTEAGTIYIPAKHCQTGRKLRLQVRARDVSITLSRAPDSSIINLLEMEIDQISPVHDGHVNIRLRRGEASLLARITEKSRLNLQLSEGMEVVAQLKAMAIESGT